MTNKTILITSIIAMTFLIGFSAQDAFAANFNSNGAGGGLWSSGATWVDGVPPASSNSAADNITIKSGDTVTLNFTYFACSDNIVIEPGATLILTFTPRGVLNTCTSSTLTNQGTMQVDGQVAIRSGTSFVNEGQVSITWFSISSGDIINRGTIDINPHPTLGQVGHLQLTDDSFTNDCGGIININGASSLFGFTPRLTSSPGTTFTNLGTVNLIGGAVHASGTWINFANIQNHGTINESFGPGTQAGQVLNFSGGQVTNLPDVCITAEIGKTLVEGPEQIGIYLPDPTTYTFEISYMGPATQILDTVPAEFDIVSLTPSAGIATSAPTSQGNDNSAERIVWDVPAGTNTLLVEIQTVPSQGGGHKDSDGNPVTVHKPTSCGELALNDGATAFEVNDDGTLRLVEVINPDTAEVTLEPVVIVGPSNSIEVEAVDGAKPCVEIEDEDDDEEVEIEVD